MDYQGKITKFLGKPENLPIALEVSKYVELLREEIHESFWEQIYADLQRRITSSKISNHWFIKFEDNSDFNMQYFGILICMKNIPKAYKGSYLSFDLEQGTLKEKNELYFGLAWNKPREVWPKLGIFNKLLDASEDAGVPISDGEVYWATILYLDMYPRSDDFILQFCLDRENSIKVFSDRIWGYFTTIEPLLSQVNQTLISG